MKMKVTCIAILLLAGFLTTAASAEETYRITVPSTSKIGVAEFPAGEYKITVGSPKIALTELKTGKLIELEAKVESVEKKFPTTEIHSKKVDGVSQISEIRIGGSKTRITFE